MGSRGWCTATHGFCPETQRYPATATSWEPQLDAWAISCLWVIVLLIYGGFLGTPR